MCVRFDCVKSSGEHEAGDDSDDDSNNRATYYHPCKKNSAGGGKNALTHAPKMAGRVGRKCKRNPQKSKRNGGWVSG